MLVPCINFQRLEDRSHKIRMNTCDNTSPSLPDDVLRDSFPNFPDTASSTDLPVDLRGIGRFRQFRHVATNISVRPPDNLDENGNLSDFFSIPTHENCGDESQETRNMERLYLHSHRDWKPRHRHGWVRSMETVSRWMGK